MTFGKTVAAVVVALVVVNIANRAIAYAASKIGGV